MADNPMVPYMHVFWQGSDISSSVTAVEIEDHDLLIDRATILLDDDKGVGINLSEEGQTIKIDMGWNSEHAVLFEGLTHKPEGKANQKGKTLRITAFDFSDKLHRKYRSDTYTGKLSDIITKLVKDKNIEVGPGDIAPDPDPTFDKDPLAQTNETDLQFIQKLARKYRARAFVEYNDNKSKFYFMPVKKFLDVKQGLMRYCRGTPLLEFNYKKIAKRADALRDDSRVDPYTGEIITSKAPEPPPPPAPTLDAETTGALASSGMTSLGDSAEKAVKDAPEKRTEQMTQQTASGGASDPDEAQLANQQDPTRASGLFGKGTVVGTIKLRAKGTVKIEGIAQWAEGDWYVAVVKHIYRKLPDKPLYHTRFFVTR